MSETAIETVPKVSLPEVLDLKAATPLAAQFLSLRGLDIAVDASRVQRVGGQCLQVLLSAVATWNHDGLALDFINLSPEFVENLQLLGIRPPTIIDGDLPQ
jgi:chemotaxis protein CheX